MVERAEKKIHEGLSGEMRLLSYSSITLTIARDRGRIDHWRNRMRKMPRTGRFNARLWNVQYLESVVAGWRGHDRC